EVLILPYDASLYSILDRGLAGHRCLESDHRLDAAGSLDRAAIAPASVIELRPALAACLLAHLCQFLGRCIAAIGFVGRQQFLCYLTMARRARELINGLAVPI